MADLSVHGVAMSNNASGKYAFGFCSRTGFRYPLKDLVDERVQGKRTGRRVGRDVADEDHPQNWMGRNSHLTNDPQSLRDARPDPALRASRNLWSWNPAGAIGLEMRGMVGTVTVETT